MQADGATTVQPDPGWRMLFRICGASAGLFVALLLAAIGLAIATPPPPTAGGAATLEYIASHRTLYVVHQQQKGYPRWFKPILAHRF